MRTLAALLLLAALSFPARAGEAPPRPRPVPETLFTPASAVDPALADVLTLPADARYGVRYVSAYAAREEDLAKAGQTLAFVFNSLSRHSLLLPPVPVPGGGGRLWRLDLHAAHIPPRAFDRLLRLGSGRVPIPEPYFRLVFRAKVRKPGAARAVEVFRSERAPWLPDAWDRLAAHADTDYPLVRADWLFTYATLEPRYHELLGLGESKEDFEKLAAADEKLADREGQQTSGVVLRSEVADHIRRLERTPTILRRGRGYYWESYDYETSVGGDDLLRDANGLLNETPAAQELITSLRNGLQAYLVVDAKGKRLDRAAANVARDKRTPLSSVEVEIRNCMICHARGMVPIEDEVRLSARDRLAVALRALKKRDVRRAERVADRYFATNLADELQGDVAGFEAAVRATNGLAAAANALQFQEFLVAYERDLAPEGLALETGYPALTVRAAVERSAATGLDHSVVATANARPRKVRRDQLESVGFGQLMRLLTRVPVEVRQ